MADSQLTDPLSRTFVLTDDTWHRHILKGHRDLSRYRTQAEQAVTNPESIWVSSSDPECRICYGKVPRRKVYIAVVVDVNLGIVKTAHLAKKITGAKQEWPPPTTLDFLSGIL